MACKQSLDWRCVLIIGSQQLGCWGQNTSRIRNKEVYATFCLQAGAADAVVHMGDHAYNIGADDEARGNGYMVSLKGYWVLYLTPYKP